MRTHKTLTALAAAAVLALTGCTAEPGEAESTSSTTAAPVEQPVLPVALPDITKMYIFSPDATLWIVSPGGTEVLAPVTAEVAGAGTEGSRIGGGYITLTTATGERLFIAGVTPTVAEGDAVEAGDRLGSVQRLPEQSLRADSIAFEVRDADGLPLDPRVWLAGS